MNDDNPALNNDVASIIENVQALSRQEEPAAPESDSATTQTDAGGTDSKSDQHLFLSNYDNNAKS